MEVREASVGYAVTATPQVAKGYKQTEVGVIPEDWDVAALDSLGRRGRPAIKAGPFGSSLTKNTYVAEGYKVYGQEQVIRGDYLNGDYYITKSRFNELKSCAVEAGDILLSLVGTAGRILVIPPGAPAGIINPRLIRFSFDPEVISPRYFRFLFEAEAYQALLARSAQGGTMGVLNAGLLRPICIPLPPVLEQEAIAEALSDADALIESLEQLLAKKRQVKQGAMQELLTGKKRLPGFSGEWRACQLGDVINHCSSGATPYRGRPEYYKGTVKWITSGELNYNVITDTIEHISVEAVQLTNLKIHPAGTFLMAITGLEAAGTRGACGIVGSPATTNQSCMAIYPSPELKTEFLYHYYVLRGSDLALQYCQGTKQQSYTAKLVRLLPIDLPPSVEEQTAIAAILTDMDAELAILEAKLAKARSLKQGMMQELLTGRIRLV